MAKKKKKKMPLYKTISREGEGEGMTGRGGTGGREWCLLMKSKA